MKKLIAMFLMVGSLVMANSSGKTIAVEEDGYAIYYLETTWSPIYSLKIFKKAFPEARVEVMESKDHTAIVLVYCIPDLYTLYSIDGDSRLTLQYDPEVYKDPTEILQLEKVEELFRLHLKSGSL